MRASVVSGSRSAGQAVGSWPSSMAFHRSRLLCSSAGTSSRARRRGRRTGCPSRASAGTRRPRARWPRARRARADQRRPRTTPVRPAVATSAPGSRARSDAASRRPGPRGQHGDQQTPTERARAARARRPRGGHGRGSPARTPQQASTTRPSATASGISAGRRPTDARRSALRGVRSRVRPTAWLPATAARTRPRPARASDDRAERTAAAGSVIRACHQQVGVEAGAVAGVAGRALLVDLDAAGCRRRSRAGPRGPTAGGRRSRP